MTEDYTTIRLKTSTRNEIAELGGKDDSFDTIMQTIVTFYKKHRACKEVAF